jgi:6-phosphofructokinase 1
MGRSCGYLALMGAISGGADWVLIPESPPSTERWEEHMCSVLKAGREAGRRDSIVIVAEGARDWHGNPISADYVKQVLEERLGEDTRVTILGHVQRGGMPSAFDRYMSTLLGHAAVEELLLTTGDGEPQLIGLRNNRITRSPLMQCVEQTHAVANAIAAKEYDKAMELRGGSFKDALQTLHTLTRVLPSASAANRQRRRFLVLNASGLSPGMNTAVRIAVRLGLDQGHTMLAARNGFRGLIGGSIIEQNWMSVSGWASRGGAELGTSRKVPRGKDLYAIARNLEEHQVQGILMIGGWAGYQAAYQLYAERRNFSAFNIPIVCLPATINNNLPGTELSIGADTALNNIVRAVDNIKQSAVASGRCFVVEVMGRDCGYLSLMGGLASGAERVYLPEEGVTLDDLREDLTHMIASFKRGKRLSLMIRNENANPIYTTGFMCSLFEEEGRDLFSVRQAILGHVQQGGDPSPFDRIQATRLTAKCIEFLIREADNSEPMGAFIGLQSGKITFTNLEDLPRMVDEANQRPRVQWWMDLRRIARTLSRQRYDD